MNVFRYFFAASLLFNAVIYKAQEPVCSLNSLPISLIADFQNLKDYSEITLFETYILNKDTVFKKELVRKYTYQKGRIQEKYMKNIYTFKNSPAYFTEEIIDKSCLATFTKLYKPASSSANKGMKTCHYKKGRSNYEDVVYFMNGSDVSKKQKIITPLNDSVCNITEKEWRHDTLIKNKSSLIKSAVPDFTHARDLPREELENFIFDKQNRPYQLIRTTKKPNNNSNEIFQFVYNENDPLPSKIDCFVPVSKGSESAPPSATISFEKYSGKIPTCVVYASIDENSKPEEKIIIDLKIK